MNAEETDRIIEANILIGSESDPSNIGVAWQVVAMNSRSLELQLNFEKPLYISTEREPEILEVKFLDRQLFLSTDGLPLTKNNER